MSWIIHAMEESALSDAIEECEDRDCIETFLRVAGIEWKPHSFPNGETLIVADIENRKVVIDPEFPSVLDAIDWLYSIDDYRLSGYAGEHDFNEQFWHGREFASRLYHGTTDDLANQIMKSRLDPKDRTRGISNRGTGSAIFTTIYDQTREGPRYGSAVIEIDTSAMRSDGFTPVVSLEYPVETEMTRNRLAWSMGIREFENNRMQELDSDGVRETTIIVFGEIPVKYLRRIE